MLHAQTPIIPRSPWRPACRATFDRYNNPAVIVIAHPALPLTDFSRGYYSHVTIAINPGDQRARCRAIERDGLHVPYRFRRPFKPSSSIKRTGALPPPLASPLPRFTSTKSTTRVGDQIKSFSRANQSRRRPFRASLLLENAHAYQRDNLDGWTIYRSI